MKNSQLLPFERNRYYAGKVLTSTDFMAEQLYMNNKRRFLNNVMYGVGIICGLNVINLDDMSILVESGAAIDEAGREIVVESSTVKKISTLEGFDQLNGEKAYLCIRYKENEVHPVYNTSTNTQEEAGYENNRIEEGYELYFQNAVDVNIPAFEMDDEFLFEKILLDDDEFLLKLRIPAAVPKGEAVKLVFEIKKKRKHPTRLSFHAAFQMPIFTTDEGSHTLDVNFSNLSLEEDETVCRNYWVNVEETELEETNLIARKEAIQIFEDEHPVEVMEDLAIKLVLVDLTPEELATREIAKMNLEMRNVRMMNNSIKLAEVSFEKAGTSYILSGIKEQEIKNYIATPGEIYHRSRYLSYFKERGNTVLPLLQENGLGVSVNQKPAENQIKMASGRIQIPLKVNMRKGTVCYSEEIIHGLGKGNVYVSVGFSYKEENANMPQPMDNTIYGDVGLFENTELMQMKTAVKVMKEKGSFQVAVKLLSEQKSIVVDLDWVAMKFSGEAESSEIEIEKMRIIPEHPTVRLGAGDQYFFEVRFENMQACPLSYTLTESGSGEISSDGVYKAPSKEGVYEIKIFCTDRPKISTYVYAIVNK